MFIVYHIPGIKVGLSKNVKARVKQQGFTEYEILEVYQNRAEASKRERQLQKELGYEIDFTSYETLHTKGFLRPEAKAKANATCAKKYGVIAGQCHTPEIRAKAGMAIARPVLQFNKQGDFITEWPSMSKASKTLNVDFTGICNCCKGKQKKSGGFIWKYKHER